MECLKFHAPAHRFAFYPLAPHVSGTTSFLLASALCRSPHLAMRRRRRHAMRQNDFCHPNELRAPAPRRVPGSLRHFRSGDPARLLRLRAVMTGGPEVFTTSETASADTPSMLFPSSTVSRPGETSVGVFFPRRRCAIEPLTSLSPSLVHPPPRSPSRALLPGRMSFSRRGDPGRRMRCWPRPPIALLREKPRLVSIQDAFYR